MAVKICLSKHTKAAYNSAIPLLLGIDLSPVKKQLKFVYLLQLQLRHNVNLRAYLDALL